MTKKKERLVAIVWTTNPTNPDPSFSFLAYDGGAGPVRVYHRDQYDGRCDLGRNRAKDGPLPFFRHWQEAFDYLTVSPPSTTIQVEVGVLRRVFPGIDLADAGERQCDDGIDSPTRNVGEV